MPWFFIIFFLSFTFSNLSEASHGEKPDPSAVVVGTVYCDTCFQEDFSRNSHFISGAHVAVECKDEKSRPSFREEAKTDEHGEFKVHLPFSVAKHVKKIQRCSVELLSSSEPFCAVASTATSSSLRLKSRKEGTHIFSAGFFTFKPEKQPFICNQKPRTGNSREFSSRKASLPPVDNPTFPSPLQDPKIPGLHPVNQNLPPLPVIPGVLPPLPPLPPLPVIPGVLPPLPPLPPLPHLPGVPLLPPVPADTKKTKTTESLKSTTLPDEKAMHHTNPTFPSPLQDPKIPGLPPVNQTLPPLPVIPGVLPPLPPLPPLPVIPGVLPPLPPLPPLPHLPGVPLLPPVPADTKKTKTTESLKSTTLPDEKAVHHTNQFGFPTPPLFPPIIQPPPLFPPILQPPPLFPPVLPPNPLQPSPKPFLPLPPIPGLTPPPPPPFSFIPPLPPLPPLIPGIPPASSSSQKKSP